MRRIFWGALLGAALNAAVPQAARAQSNTAIVAGPVGAVMGGLVGAAWGESTRGARPRHVRPRRHAVRPPARPRPVRVAQRPPAASPAAGRNRVDPR